MAQGFIEVLTYIYQGVYVCVYDIMDHSRMDMMARGIIYLCIIMGRLYAVVYIYTKELIEKNVIPRVVSSIFLIIITMAFIIFFCVCCVCFWSL